MDVLSLVNVVCCQVQVCVSGQSLIQRSPTECGVSECDCEASIMGRPWPTGGLSLHGGETKLVQQIIICIHERISVYDPALQIAAPSTFMAWLLPSLWSAKYGIWQCCISYRSLY